MRLLTEPALLPFFILLSLSAPYDIYVPDPDILLSDCLLVDSSIFFPRFWNL
jgi:hypothetical protein